MSEINRQQREMLTLRVRKLIFYCRKDNDPTHPLVARRTEEGCRPRWRLNWIKSKRRMLRLIGNREKYKH